MKLKIIQLASRLRSSYWFIPATMGIGAILLSIVTIFFDLHLGMKWSDEFLGVFSNKPEGARTFLSAVSSSMISVAGVTFSLTIVAVSFASSQYGPRILTNFMRDTRNQITLGTFIATYLYCLLILRTVRGADEKQFGSDQLVIGAFVPHISLLVALFLVVVSVAVLIHFFHHIPESIRLSNVVEGVGRQLLAQISHAFPKTIGEGSPPSNRLTPTMVGTAVTCLCRDDGYIEMIDGGDIIEKAKRHDLVVELLKRPGDFVSVGTPLFRLWFDQIGEHGDEARADIYRCFAWGNGRTPGQDLMFLVDELVEVAARALSPGVNDPFTAMNCIDWLESALSALSRCQDPDSVRQDAEGKVRLTTRDVGFVEICSAIGKKLQPYASTDRNAAIHFLTSLGAIRAKVGERERIECLNGLADSLVKMSEANELFEDDLNEMKKIKEDQFPVFDTAVHG